MMIYLAHYLPFKKPYNNSLEIMNELFIILLVYLVWVLSDITEKGKTKHEIGYIYCGVIILFLLFNLAAIIFMTLQ